MIPGLGFPEFLMIAAAALIFVGPKGSAGLMRQLGQWVRKGQVLAREFRAAFDDIARQTELEDLKKEIESLRQDNALRAAADEFSDVERDINAAVMRGAPLTTETLEKLENAPGAETPPETPKGDTAAQLPQSEKASDT